MNRDITQMRVQIFTSKYFQEFFHLENAEDQTLLSLNSTCPTPEEVNFAVFLVQQNVDWEKLCQRCYVLTLWNITSFHLLIETLWNIIDRNVLTIFLSSPLPKMLCSYSVVYVMFLAVSPRKQVTLAPYHICLQGLEKSLSRLFHVFFLPDRWGCWSLLPPQYLDVIEGLLGPLETIQMAKCTRVTSRYLKCYGCRSSWPELS